MQGKNYINGQWETTEKNYFNINPATSKRLGQFPLTQGADVDRAIKSARSTFENWRKVSRFVRSDYMNKVAQIIEQKKG